MRVSAIALAGLLASGCPRSEAPSPEAAAEAEPPASAPASPPTSKSASQPASRPATPVPPAAAGVPVGVNRSGIRYAATATATCDGRAPCPCAAPELFHGKNALARVGVEAAELGRGTPCLLADFDGDGHTDAAFLGEAQAGLHPVVVLMHDEVGLAATHELPKPVKTLRLAEGVPERAALADGDVLFVLSAEEFRVAMRPK